MRKWLGWTLRMLATAVLLSFLSIWTTGYIVNSYIETILQQLNLPLETRPYALSGVWGKLWGVSAAPPKKEAAAEKPSAPPTRYTESPDVGDAVPEPAPAPQSGLGQADSDLGAQPDAPSVSQNPAEDDGSVPAMGVQGSLLDMSEQERETLRAVMSKLNGEQLTELSFYLEDGLTEEECEAVGRLVEPSLSPGEYEAFMELLEVRTASAGAAGPEIPDAIVE